MRIVSAAFAMALLITPAPSLAEDAASFDSAAVADSDLGQMRGTYLPVVGEVEKDQAASLSEVDPTDYGQLTNALRDVERAWDFEVALPMIAANALSGR